MQRLVPILICLSAANAAFAGTALQPTLATPAPDRAMVKATSAKPSGDDYQTRQLSDLAAAAEQIRAECQTGSLLFSQGDCLAVKAYTGSRFTHVAAVVIVDQDVWVYDSMNGAGVRRLRLDEFLFTQSPDELLIVHPIRELTSEEQADFQTALDDELGRPYSVSHFITGNQCEGLHCGEYVTTALIEIDWLRAENPARVSPASLLEGVTEHDIYSTGPVLKIPQALVPIPEKEHWCARLWQQTTLCVSGGCTQLSRWFLCR